MRVPLAWLREFVDIDETVEALVERLPMLGLGVDGVEGAGASAVLDLEIASNRPDLLGLVGIAREIAAWTRREVRLPPDDLADGGAPVRSVAAVKIADPARCARYVAHVITGVRVGPSPPRIAGRLEAAGIRPINNVVDATNYAMLEWGQPLHAFDLERLEGRRIVVRAARPDESLVTLDGVTRPLDPSVLVIADARRPVALAGIIGGAATEIATATTTVLLEAASFQAASVRRAARALGLRTEASARFERGVDPEGTLRAARRCAALIAELAGGTVLRGAVDVYPGRTRRRAITLRLARVPRLLGVEVPADEVVAILSRLGLEVRARGRTVRAVPPAGRRDLEREEDLIEEVARHWGYERIPEALPVEVVQPGRRMPSIEVEAAARDALIRAGLTEALTVSLVTPRLLDRLGLGADDPWRRAVPVQNPLTADHTHLRPCLLPGLLEAVRANVSRRREAVHIFEIGRVFRAGGGAPEERKALAVALRGPWGVGAWGEGGGAREVTFFHLRGALDVLAAELRAGELGLEAGGPGWLQPGRAARVLLDGAPLGVAGELHPDAAARFDLPGRTYVAELDLDALLARAVLQPRFAGIPRFPAVRRDVAVVAPEDLPHAAVVAALRATAGELLESVELFDVYAGPPLPPGTRNLAYALSFRARDRTLTGEEVDGLMAHIHAALPERLPIRMRT
ncbi:MAG: phenylalanine--tRNA ligase subunit beta [Armatimonadota bacterium]|nr:phenylalanine--tRNA ligase subunit beta [Armatimonadota bacterium]